MGAEAYHVVLVRCVSRFSKWRLPEEVVLVRWGVGTNWMVVEAEDVEGLALGDCQAIVGAWYYPSLDLDPSPTPAEPHLNPNPFVPETLHFQLLLGKQNTSIFATWVANHSAG